MRLGIIDDGTPNAFTFGHTRSNARIHVSRGLIDRLDERELDAVVSHEVGHVRHNGVLVMAIAATVPIVLYYVHLVLRDSRQQSTVVPAIVGHVGYVLSQLVVLSLGRARELVADHYSCRVTGDGDALGSAPVRIGCGMGQADAEREARPRGRPERGPWCTKGHGRGAAAGPAAAGCRVLGIADHQQRR